jgi:hypothetical protein
MQPSDEASPDISRFETLLNDNWNERKRLVEVEFSLRSEVQSLLQNANSREAVDKARVRENECRTSLSRNDEEYRSLVDQWTSETFATPS